jgi:flagellin
MSLAIVNNTSAAFASLSLNNATQALQSITNDLSSGVRIHTAGDDPSGIVLANGMQTTISGLTQASQNNQSGISLIQTADGAMDQISSTLLTMRTLAVNAANAGVQDPQSLSALQDELNQAASSITAISTDTSFANEPLLDGSLDDDRIDTGSTAVLSSVNQNATLLPSGVATGSVLTATAAGPQTLSHSTVQVTLTGTTTPLPGSTLIQGLTQNGTALGATANKTYTVTGPLGSQTLTLYPSSTINDVLAEVNAYTAQTGARASYDPSTGALTLASTSFGAGPLSVTSQDMSGTSANIGLFDSDTTGVTPNTYATAATNQTLTLTYTDSSNATHTVNLVEDPTSPGGLTFTNPAGGPEAVPPYSVYDPGAFSVVVNDTSGGGITGTVSIPAGNYTATRHSTAFIQTGDQADQTSPLDIPDMNAAALGHTAGLASTGLASIQDLVTTSALSSGNATQALAVIDAAINEVSLARGQLGSLQADGLQTALSSLQVTTTNLTTAESQIRDTDMAQESAAYARENIIFQSATAMLTQANQVPQTVLSLLKDS